MPPISLRYPSDIPSDIPSEGPTPPVDQEPPHPARPSLTHRTYSTSYALDQMLSELQDSQVAPSCPAAAPQLEPVLSSWIKVGTGTSASCTEAAFDNALAKVNASSTGGKMRFDCGSQPVKIVFSSTKNISRGIVIDGGARDRIALSGNGKVRLFRSINLLDQDIVFQNITLRDGNAGECSLSKSFEDCSGGALLRIWGRPINYDKRIGVTKFLNVDLINNRSYDLRTVQEIVGHQDIKTTMGYTHRVAENIKKVARNFTLGPKPENKTPEPRLKLVVSND